MPKRTTPGPESPSIERFDCSPVDAPAASGCDGPVTPFPQGLRGFSLGGPEGSAFNAQFLECGARMRTPCSAPAVLNVFVGNRRLQQLALPAGSHHDCRFGLGRAQWAAEFDAPRELAYDTALLRVELRQACGDPPYPVQTQDTFLGGFASGE